MVAKSTVKGVKKNLLNNYETADAVKGNPYLLEINKSLSNNN
jgi:hypothetical protein